MKSFNIKFGVRFLESIPNQPGVYRIYNNQATLIYVGKAKNLRRRLGNYKNAKRKKKHRKMNKIIEEAADIQYEICESELEAHILEAKLIQSFRPKWNIVGAFYFMYPLIGMNLQSGTLQFTYTTQPELFSEFLFHGAFRSREITRDAFFSLMQLLKYVGHSVSENKTNRTTTPKYSYVYGFRQLPSDWFNLWETFWRGESIQALEQLILALVENAGARSKPKEIQKKINQLKRFWLHEAKLLKKVRTAVNYASYPVSQKERDLIFLQYRYRSAVPTDSIYNKLPDEQRP